MIHPSTSPHTCNIWKLCSHQVDTQSTWRRGRTFSALDGADVTE